MSLYRHVRGKDGLVLLMIDAAIGEERFPATPPPGWRAGLEVRRGCSGGASGGTPGLRR